MPEWTHETRTDGVETATALHGRWRLFLMDHRAVRPDAPEPVQWFARFDRIFFGGVEGRARDLDDGKAQALAAAERLQAEMEAQLQKSDNKEIAHVTLHRS